MAKSLLTLSLPLCCVMIFQGLQAQDYRNADTAIPRKLELRKGTIGIVATTGSIGPTGNTIWVDRSAYLESPNSVNYFAKRPEDADTGNSILYLGPPKADTFDLNLPRQQASHLTLRASMRRQQPLFRIGQ